MLCEKKIYYFLIAHIFRELYIYTLHNFCQRWFFVDSKLHKKFISDISHVPYMWDISYKISEINEDESLVSEGSRPPRETIFVNISRDSLPLCDGSLLLRVYISARIRARAASKKKKTHYLADNDYESWKLPIPSVVTFALCVLRDAPLKGGPYRAPIAHDLLLSNAQRITAL